MNILPADKLRLPSDLQPLIKRVVKKTTAGNTSTVIHYTEDDLWLLSMSEMGFNATAAISGQEGEQYELFRFGASKIKYFNTSLSASAYLSRSPTMNTNNSFNSVTTTGASATTGAALVSASAGAFGLCV